MDMKKIAPWLRIAFLVLFFVLLKNGFLLGWLGLYVASLLLPLLFGKRLYCLLACPINTLIVWIARFKARRGYPNRPLPRWLAGGGAAWFSLALTIAAFFLTRKVLGRDFPMMLIWLAVAGVMTFFYHPDVFHDRVCPFGVAQAALAKVSLRSPQACRQARDYQGFTASILKLKAGPADTPGGGTADKVPESAQAAQAAAQDDAPRP